MVSTPAQVAALSALDLNKRAVAGKDYRHTIQRACKDLRWEAGDLRITRVSPCVARGLKPQPGLMFAGGYWWRSLAVYGGSGHHGALPPRARATGGPCRGARQG